jgi:hypothetical protein
LGESTKVEIAADGTFVRIWPFPALPRRRSSNDLHVVQSRPRTRRNIGIGPARKTIGDVLNASIVPRRIAPFAAAFLLLALTMLVVLSGSSPASAKSTCSSTAAARAKQHVHACPARHSMARAHTKAKAHHAKHNHSKKKKKAKVKPKSTHTPAPVLRPATCEDGTTPKPTGEGEYTCGDGSEPVCANGAEPTAKHGGARLLCPAKPGSEFSEASCEDGSSPEHVAAGSPFSCEDGSQPSCEDGSQPKLSDDGSMLACLTSGPAGSSSPSEEADEDEDEDELAS